MRYQTGGETSAVPGRNIRLTKHKSAKTFVESFEVLREAYGI
jgi:hypothetical protein